LQVLIAVTGNYTFFNLLTMFLCIPLFDDACWRQPAPPATKSANVSVQGRPATKWLTAGLIFIVLVLTFRPVAWLSPFGLVNQYGLFASMTTERREITIEGSMDGETWQPYVFPYKPGPLNRPLQWVAPAQPRLDWQMWFAALGNFRSNPWFARLALVLLQGSGPVNDLFEKAPFGNTPPKYIRATIDLYRYTTADERARTGALWKKEAQGLYFPPVSLRQ
jgi:hypothetical protein